METAPPHELKNVFQMLQEILVSVTFVTLITVWFSPTLTSNESFISGC